MTRAPVRSLRLAAFLFVVAVVAVTARTPAAQARTLAVVATVGDLGAIAREVLGPGSQVTVLAKPEQDPHFVDAKPSLMVNLNRADALCAMGLDYEVGWLPVLVRGARNPAIAQGGPGYIDASTMIGVLDVPSGRVDRSMGDIHPGGNPHFTLDPRNAIRIASGLAERFGRLDAAGRDGYARNAASFAERLQAKIQQWQARLAGARGVPVVTYHKSFTYLIAWLGLTEVDTLEPKPGIPPSPSHIAEVVNAITARHVRAILQERWYPSNTAQLVARQTGTKLILIAGMTAVGTSYIDHVEEIVRQLAEVVS